jgi:PKD domain
MRYVFNMTLLAVAILASGVAGAQNLSVTNYQLVSSQQATASQSYLVYRADLVNSGPALASVSASVSSVDPYSVRIVPGQDTLNFAPVPANGKVTSSNTFTILVPFNALLDPSKVQWTFHAMAVGLTANAGPNQTANVGALVTLDGSGSTNPSGIGTLTYSWKFTSRPPGSSAVLFNNTLVDPVFVIDFPGTYVITLTVSNGVETSSASVTVSTGNSPPVAKAGPNQTVLVGSTVFLDGSGSSDVDGDPLTYSWMLTTKPSGSAANLTGSNSITPTFVADKPGTYVAQLTVSDGISSSSATVTITTANSPPVARAGPNQTVNVGALVQLDGSGSTDVDGNPLTYRWSLLSKPGGSTAVLNNSGIVNPTFVADLAGTYIAQLIVNDGQVDSAPSTVTITTGTIQAPTANAGPNQTVLQHTVVVLNGVGSDPQGLPLTYLWAFLSVPPGSTAVLSSTTAPNPSFSADLPGTYIAQLIVNNGFKSSAPSTVMITTSSNLPPVANAGSNQTVAVGSTVTLDGTNSSDSDNNPLTYGWGFLSRPPGSVATLTGSHTANPTFVADVTGTYVVQLIVNDGFQNSVPATVTITTQGMSLTPNPLNLTDTPGTLTVTLSSPAGPGGQIVNLASVVPGIASVPASVNVSPGASSVDFTVTPGTAGSTLILATASGYSNATTTVNVTPSAPRPTISFSPASVTITGTATQTLTLNLSSPAPPAGQTINLSSDNTGVATVPATVTFPGGSTSVNVPVTGVAPGSATIHASALPNIADTTASVTVISSPSGIVMPSTATLQVGDTTALSVTLAQPAPSGGVFISLSSDNPSVTVSPANILILEGRTAPNAPPKVSGNSVGSANVTASAYGFASNSTHVTVNP